MFAMRRPMTSKLYFEALQSALMGAAIGYTYTYYYKNKYNEAVDETYELLKNKFATNPILATMKED